jgi:hypothetical protein
LKEVVYAVYRHQGGRWTRDRSFSSEQRDEAKAAAETLLTRQGVLGVTLVEETFVPSTGETKEVGIWSKTNNPAVPALGVATRKEREKAAEAAPATTRCGKEPFAGRQGRRRQRAQRRRCQGLGLQGQAATGRQGQEGRRARTGGSGAASARIGERLRTRDHRSEEVDHHVLRALHRLLDEVQLAVH